MTFHSFPPQFENKNQYLGLNQSFDFTKLGLSFRVKRYKKNEYIFREGDLINGIYIVLEGRVKEGVQNEEGKEMIKDIYGAGEIFGELALIGLEKRKTFAKVLEATKIQVIDNQDLKNLLFTHPAFGNLLMNTLGTRLVEMEQRFEALVFKSSRTRIIEFLLSLCRKRGQRVGFEMVVRKFMTHQEIAGITGTSRQTVTTVLNELRNKNILTFNRRRLLIRNMNLLLAEAQ